MERNTIMKTKLLLEIKMMLKLLRIITIIDKHI